MKKLFLIGLLFVASVLVACDSNAFTSLTPTPQTEVPTVQPTPTATPKPVQGPLRETINQIEKDIASPYDPIIESYDQPTATVQVANKLGASIVANTKTVKSVIKKYMKGHFSTHNDVYILKVIVQIYGTIRRGTSQNGYGVIARATMLRTDAQSIDWTFASDDDVWSKCKDMWLDQGVIENS